MIIKVTDKYYIESDERNFCVCEDKVVEKGKTAGAVNKKTYGFYPSVISAIESIVALCFNDGTEEFNGTLENYAQKIFDISKDTVRKVNNVVSNGIDDGK